MKNKTINISIIIGLFIIIIINLIIIIKPFRINNYKTYFNITSNYSNTIAVKIENDNGEYESSDSIPTSGYALNTDESYCGLSNGDGTYTKDDNITINYQNGTISLGKMTKRKTKCFLYFDIQPTALETLLANNTVDSSRKSGSFTSTYTTDTAGKIFEGPADDYGDTTYFFAGANPNNWVKFAGFYWRIIRINGNGSIRLIYNGTDTTTTGTTTQISTSAFNTSTNDNAYVGYMYGTTGSSTYAATHANTNSSTIKGVLDKWYPNNITSYSDKIDTDVGFCGDRKVYSGSSWSDFTTLGYGTNATTYEPASRVLTWSSGSSSWSSTQTGTYKCSQSADLYTVSNSSYGNKALTYPIGLISIDEVIFGGGFGGSSNTSYWLYTGQYYWTISPIAFSGYSASVVYVNSDGNLYSIDDVSYSIGAKPVINLKPSTILTGTGTSTDPYIVN